MSNVNQFERKGPVSKPVEPQLPDVDLDPLFSERLEHMNRAHSVYGISYFPSDYSEKTRDIQEVFCTRYMRQYPQSTEISLLSLKRVLLRSDQFEGDDYTIKKGVRSALTLKLDVRIWDPESFKLNARIPIMIDDSPAIGTYCVFSIGSYRAPLVSPVMDKSSYPPRIREYRVSSYQWRYYVPDNPTTINSIIKKWGEPVKPFTVSIANLNSPEDSPFDGNKSYTINSKEDFINTPIEELIDMNKTGYVKKGDLSSVLQRYRQFKQKKKAIEEKTGNEIMPITPETAEFLKQNKLSIDSLVEQLRLNTTPIETPKKKARK